MKNIIRFLLLTTFVIGLSKVTLSEEWPVLKSHKNNVTNKSIAEGCLPASASTDLDVNNVRARINTGGDMWWDLQGNAEYFIPGNTTKTSMFSAALWIGGLDVNGQLKLCANRYRGNGNDYWTGPISRDGTASTDAETCEQYDKFFVITRAEVEEFKAAFVEGFPAGYEIPRSIRDWPAMDPDPSHSPYLAPFFDQDGDLTYNPDNGDYPYYDFDNTLCPINYPPGTPQPKPMEGIGILADQVLKGDKTLWWVFNDKGNIHTETKGEAIGLEIRAQAFGFSTNDEINNMTFYSYEIINRSTYRLTETYFSQWVDTDLGYAQDDYVGCDVLRGLGYCYNGVDPDGQGKPQDYGAQPPAVGVDFFQGPYMDPDGCDNPKFIGDSLGGPSFGGSCNIVSQDGAILNMIYQNDTSIVSGNFIVRAAAINGVNFGNGLIDDERFGMRRFVYHNNTGGLDAITDPDIAPEYYNLLRGIWKDNERMIYWGLGHPSAGGTGPPCDFMFPDDTDPCNWGTMGVSPGGNYPNEYWTEEQAKNPPYDRRFMQSAGPFTLEPGAVNYITVGIPWARATSGGPFASVELLRSVDDKCQALFDNCFKVLDGPDAPDLTIQELDRELILYISNRKGVSNNYNDSIEDYIENDNTITYSDKAYRFQGYQIFQVKDASVSVTDIHDPDLARLVAQCDIKDNVSQIVNFYFSEQLNGNVPVEEVNGSNSGIVHSFRLFEDMFAVGDKRLVNHKQYYYIAIAYSYNNYKPYNQSDPLYIDGQKKPYLAGRKAASGSIQAVSAMPHIPSPEAGGTILKSEYGVMPQITRLEGNGNGGLVLDFTTETHSQMMASSPNFSANPTYDYNKGPLNIKVIDPLNVVADNFKLKLIPPADGNLEMSNWLLSDSKGNTWNSEKTIAVANEQLLLDLGLSLTISQPKFPGDSAAINNGYLEATIQFADSSKKWLSGVPDIDSYAPYNWIRSGTVAAPDDGDPDYPNKNDYDLSHDGSSIIGTAIDPGENYEKILGGTWAPYRLSSMYKNGPAWNAAGAPFFKWNKLENLYSIDLYLTPDPSKWTKCVVIEECEDINSSLSEGNIKKFELRAGKLQGEDAGIGYFPGYAINVETGERLNMMFGEDSWLQGENGRDMIWNPTSNYNSNLGDILFGGKHWVYIMGHNGDAFDPTFNVIKDCPAYDEGAWIKSLLSATANHTRLKQFVYKDVMWVGCPIISDAKYTFADPKNMPCEVKIRIRVSRPYKRYYSTAAKGAVSPENDNYPMYQFNTESLATIKGNAMAAEGSLNLINVVPNPYFAYSGYEKDQLDNRIRITNLPQKCAINIYTVNGSLVRQYAKDDANSYLDWDLKNYAGIPIAGGMYLIYVKVDGVGEKVLKWFGSLRPIDLNAF
jgi:hypothetical protein